ncbi:inactive ubiquitin carboxyl-terminal hydrolase MINDY-4B [Uranotaenia lowii]|uniref:inactive ubiquitin carboxyl-terminal hydrolase MINDY-4B n=1 Tax=Uranotaenia lowii TaxID=190385 RepID=UPI002478AA8A|nr:inactive ubiquitin carboxyl-terminal hydrolase MINDY-4B [Uranotaenia lowii]XP_055606144.1 inactive ubiquitin carboxyl-terminal hydrolase MINDY-4B [Uranotaenia lowii]XP_055606145.1 inactive ubiquitin carboxyl-terminal hydrolase MINDY-4B [Uranotaenia lowii]XP_055606146.1 inactive ubiquitin carboxyl-terminal hydrolase MINDY-4B [Uranotaenia lowii]XP_055606147.1 inactive ubiquitin carboxyl-terminal hydrolase MINDY-4B [Uranotaenia lowii]XP_055606148.1 inactive ubiquitin carboxyl-terminal hydrolas
MSKLKLVDGRPIEMDEAIELRQAIFGSATSPPRGEWTRTGISMGPFNAEYPYGLRSPRNATRGMQSVLQAFIIKHFIFDSKRGEKTVPLEEMLKPTEAQQLQALYLAMSEILWTIGEKIKAIVALPGENSLIQHCPAYFQDNVTEKLFFFEFFSLDELQIFLKRYLPYFTENPGPGALLLLYSAVMTRGLDNMRNDLDAPKGAHLIGPHEEGSLNIVTLMLTGRATPYLHNGVVYVGDEDHYALPQFGILSRGCIGIMVWEGDNEAMSSSSRQPGSRLKTPATPIWVSSCCGHYGVLFNSNRELLRNYHAEKRFELHYYTLAGCYLSMTVDNRQQEDGGDELEGDGERKQNDITSTPLERLIHTKWMEAKITYHGPLPASLNV